MEVPPPPRDFAKIVLPPSNTLNNKKTSHTRWLFTWVRILDPSEIVSSRNVTFRVNSLILEWSQGLGITEWSRTPNSVNIYNMFTPNSLRKVTLMLNSFLRIHSWQEWTYWLFLDFNSVYGTGFYVKVWPRYFSTSGRGSLTWLNLTLPKNNDT